MDSTAERLKTFFQDTLAIFKKTTAYAILLEKIGQNTVEIGAINELRGTLFHLYAFVDENEQDNFEFNHVEAIEHLYRAYFDTFSLLCTLLLEKIHTFNNEYGADSMSLICPDYYSTIVPGCYDIQEEIANIRATREKRLLSPLKKIEANDTVIAKLLNWAKKLESIRNTLEDKKRRDKEKGNRKHKEKWNFLFLGAIIGGIIGGIITILIKIFT